MLTGIYSAGSGILAAEQRQQVVAENLANLDVPGFRRMFASLEQVAAPRADLNARSGVVLQRVTRDFQPGTMETTSNPLDLALEGDGLFAVDGPRGILYTRSGVMQVDGQGRLVTNSGFPFRGLDPLPAGTTPDQIRVEPDGTVFAGDTRLGRLEIASFADPGRLIPVGVIYFEAPQGLSAEPADVRVLQGQREGANVNPTEELVQMLIGLRHHEASQRALRSLSEAVGEHARS